MKCGGVWFVLGAIGCSPFGGERLCSFPSEVGQGEGLATIDGASWQAEDVAWSESGSGLQITSEMTQGWRMTVVIQSDGLDDEGLGRVSLDGGMGWALVYPESGASYSSQDGYGSLDVVQNADTVQLCLDLEAQGDDGTVTVEEAYLHAVPLELGG